MPGMLKPEPAARSVPRRSLNIESRRPAAALSAREGRRYPTTKPRPDRIRPAAARGTAAARTAAALPAGPAAERGWNVERAVGLVAVLELAPAQATDSVGPVWPAALAVEPSADSVWVPAAAVELEMDLAQAAER